MRTAARWHPPGVDGLVPSLRAERLDKEERDSARTQEVISKHVTRHKEKRRSMSAVSHQHNRIFGHILTPLVLPAILALCASTMALAAPPLPGAIFTTDSTCTGVNLNIYGSKDA